MNGGATTPHNLVDRYLVQSIQPNFVEYWSLLLTLGEGHIVWYCAGILINEEQGETEEKTFFSFLPAPMWGLHLL